MISIINPVTNGNKVEKKRGMAIFSAVFDVFYLTHVRKETKGKKYKDIGSSHVFGTECIYIPRW